MTALMYHDIVEPGADAASGFPGKDAALYKVSPQLFDEHLRAIVGALVPASPAFPARPALAITFDDGGVSAMRAADMLERYGLKGHFFVTANYIGARGFVDRRDVLELAQRGHIVGSHSCSHPLRMGHCPAEQLVEEWTRSHSIISAILGHAITQASVPGGDFHPRVANAAAEAGFTHLYTSEPTICDWSHGPLTLHGRFTIRSWTSAKTAAALAAGHWLPRAGQAMAWNLRKTGKRIAGDRYLRLRQWLLGHRSDVQWGDAPVRRPVER